MNSGFRKEECALSFPADLGREFKPSYQLVKLYYAYLALIAPIAVLPWYIPVLVKGSAAAALGALAAVIAVLLFLLFWIPHFYGSIAYTLTEKEIVWRRGVWFKNTGIVPYDRVTNVDIAQGPLSRSLGIAALKVQTAGYSGQQKAEIRLEGIIEFEELRELIMGFVRGEKPRAVQTFGTTEGVQSSILEELVKIRKILEGYTKRDMN
jgi:membrane protein YdbS with pleckstrin-like domain